MELLALSILRNSIHANVCTLVWILNIVNAAVLLYLLYLVGKNLTADKQLPLIVFAGLIFLPFLDWLLVEWFWDPSLSLWHWLDEHQFDGVHVDQLWSGRCHLLWLQCLS